MVATSAVSNSIVYRSVELSADARNVGLHAGYQDCGRNAEGASMGRVCDDVNPATGETMRKDVQTIAECREFCADFEFLGLACPRGTMVVRC